MNNKLEVIGIDHGWSMMKTVTQVFVTGVKEITTTPALFGDVLEYDGKYYKIGTVRQEVKDTKVEDDSFYLLTLAAVAKELKKRGLSDAKVFLAVGLPLTRFGAERSNFIKYLTKNKRVDFRYENEAYHIEIDDVAVFPQCYAAVVDKIPTMAKKTLVVDIGMAVPSVSLEGKNIWVLQSLPVDPWNTLRAKLLVQILVTGVPALFCDICMFIVVKGGILEMFLALLVSGLFVTFMAMVGLVLGLKMPNLTWTNENAPIKQSISVIIAMLGGWILCAGMGRLYLIGGWFIGAVVYLTIVAVLFAGLGIVCYLWMKKRGTEIFRWL